MVCSTGITLCKYWLLYALLFVSYIRTVTGITLCKDCIWYALLNHVMHKDCSGM